MSNLRITKKHVGHKVRVLTVDCKETVTGVVVLVNHGIVKIEYQVSGHWETYTTYLAVNSDRIVAIES